MATRRSTPAAALSADVMNLVLLGWRGEFPSTTLEIFDLSERQIRDAWRRHQVAVRDEAARRGLDSIWAEERYDRTPPPWLCEERVTDGQ